METFQAKIANSKVHFGFARRGHVRILLNQSPAFAVPVVHPTPEIETFHDVAGPIRPNGPPMTQIPHLSHRLKATRILSIAVPELHPKPQQLWAIQLCLQLFVLVQLVNALDSCRHLKERA